MNKGPKVSAHGYAKGVIEPGLNQLDLRAALNYIERPAFLHEDFPESAHAAVLERIEQLVGRARQERPLAWQAYDARRALRPDPVAPAWERIRAFQRVAGRVRH